MPDEDDIIDAIKQTKNSAPGPNGIPFIFYRKFAIELAPVLLGIMKRLAKGEAPPKGFNYGNLFLFPKNNSLEIKDTRPITVGDCTNRIIAKLVTNSITPAVQKILHNSQKGFIPGRQGSEHIESIVNTYYSKLEKEKQHYLLFLDTAKAFDSIDHKFIIRVLEKIGMPSWVVSTIAGLLDSVVALPVLGNCSQGGIDIERGVKQGCPLSPLLFAICYDVLLVKLSRKQEHSDFAFADDLAIASDSLGTVADCLDEIYSFSKFSGLGLNAHKTAILTTKRVRNPELGYMQLRGYERIKFVDEAKYLGVILGRFITACDVYKTAQQKFYERLERYKPYLKTVSLHKRILTVNIYILPLFYYLAQFYVIPYYDIVVPAREAIRKTIVPFGGGGFGYAHLIATKPDIGAHTPLRDLWATNMALLGSKTHTNKCNHGNVLPDMGRMDVVASCNWDSMQIEQHRHFASFAYLREFCPRDGFRRLDTSSLKDNEAKDRPTIYKQLVHLGYQYERESPKYPSSLANKVAKWKGQANEAKPIIRNLRQHRKNMGRQFTPYIWNIFFKLLTYCWATDRDRGKRGGKPKKRTSPLTSDCYPCYICGLCDDSMTHLLRECRIVRKAGESLLQGLGIMEPFSPIDCLLLYQPTGAKKEAARKAIMQISLIGAIWIQRKLQLSQETIPEEKTMHANIVNIATDLMAPRGRSQPTRSYQKILELAENPHEKTITIFTDGSAVGEPRKAGTGIWIKSADLDICISIHLSWGDNNLGEMWGILVALLCLRRASELGLLDNLIPLLFSDSLGCIRLPH